MASLQQIEIELQATNDAIFQQLCDEYLFLSEDGFPQINRRGSQKGKRKTKKGSPDTFWVLPSGKYVFAEYTTKNKKDSAASFINKLKEDVKKCLDRTVTGVNPTLINKIILCFNSEITPAEIESVKKVLGKRQIQISFVSLDTLALNIHSRFRHLASNYLDIPLETGQIVHLTNFIEEYSAGNSITTPLSNKFCYREKELEELDLNISNSDILVLTGQPGVGKSKLAVEGATLWEKKYSDYTVYCLSNKNLSIFEDLSSTLKSDCNYLIFVDDANRQSENLLTLLPFLKAKRTGKLKIIITVREYAVEYIKRICSDFKLCFQSIDLFNDDQLKEILTGEDFKITNNLYLNRILEIAKGNPRIAIMAAKLAIEHQDLNSLHDLYDFYHAYFTTFIKDNVALDNPDVQKTLGLVSFFFSIDRSNKEDFANLLSVFNLDYYKVNEAFTHLERLELVETSADNSVVKIGDQVLSTYFFYKCFIKDKLLSFSTLLNSFFVKNKNRFSDTLLPCQSDFGYEKVIEPVQNDLISYFNSISHNDSEAFSFLDLLWFCVPDQTLGFIQEKIQHLPTISAADFKADTKKLDHPTIQDKTLKILNPFLYQKSQLLSSSLELAFEYVEKVPDQYDTLYRMIFGDFIYTYEDECYEFYRQTQLVDFLINKNNSERPIVIQMFFDLLPHLLASANMVHRASYKRDSISFYKYHVPLTETIKELRTRIWKQAYSQFSSALPHSENAIYRYMKPSIDSDKEILAFDLPFLLELIGHHFSTDRFSNCYYVQKLVQRFERLGIDHSSFSELKECFYSRHYRVYQLIDRNRLRNRQEEDFESLDYEKFERIKEIETRYKLRFDTPDQFRSFYSIFCDISLDPHIESWNSNATLDIIIHEAYLQNIAIALEYLAIIQGQGNPTGFVPDRLLLELSKMNQEKIDIVFDVINKTEYSGKHRWIQSFAFCVPEKNVTTSHYDQLMHTYSSATSYIYFDFKPLHKFIHFNNCIYPDVLRLFIEKSRQNIRAGFDFQFFELYLPFFENDFELLKEAYFIEEKSRQSFDHDGKDFLALLKINERFFEDYIQYHTNERYAISARDYDHLSIVWQLPNAEILITWAFEYFSTKVYHYVKEEFVNAFFKDLDQSTLERAKAFLINYIKSNKSDTEKVNTALDVFRNSMNRYYLEAISFFLTINNSVTDFKKLDLISSYYFGSGDVIVAALRATELGNINDMPNNTQLLQHKAYLQSCITEQNKRAELERKRKFMYDRW